MGFVVLSYSLMLRPRIHQSVFLQMARNKRPGSFFSLSSLTFPSFPTILFFFFLPFVEKIHSLLEYLDIFVENQLTLWFFKSICGFSILCHVATHLFVHIVLIILNPGSISSSISSSVSELFCSS